MKYNTPFLYNQVKQTQRSLGMLKDHWNKIKTNTSGRYSQLKNFITSQLYVGAELQIAFFQGLAVILLAAPKLLTNLNLWWSSPIMLLGLMMQYFSGRLIRKTTIHEAFLKERVNNYFDNTIGNAEDQEAGFYREELQRCLVAIMKQLGIHHSPDHRVRLFVPLDDDGSRKFCLIAFHADNPDLATSRNSYYPDEGVLGETFRRGSCYIQCLADPNLNEVEWRSQQQNTGFMNSKESVNQVKFRARSYLGIAIRSPKGSEKTCIVIIESTKPYLSTKKQALKIVERQFSWYIAKCVEKFTPYAPDPNFAAQKGF